MAVDLVQEIGRHITNVTEDSRETTFLFQRLSMALQQGNAVAFQNTMVRWSPSEISLHPLNCLVSHAYRLCAGGHKKNNNNNNMLAYKAPVCQKTLEAPVVQFFSTNWRYSSVFYTQQTFDKHWHQDVVRWWVVAKFVRGLLWFSQLSREHEHSAEDQRSKINSGSCQHHILSHGKEL